MFCFCFCRPFIRTPREGAETAIKLLLDKNLEGVSGAMFASCRQRKLKPIYLNHPQADSLWDETQKLVDATVMVHAPMEVRISRTMQRDNATRLQVEKRIRAQMDDEQKCALATYIIENDGVRSLTEQLEQLLNELNKSNSDK